MYLGCTDRTLFSSIQHYSSIASDDEFTLFGVVVFKKIHDEFIQKCRENKYIVRDFVFSEEEIARQQQELSAADTTEKELWVGRRLSTRIQ
jgi:V-type H+-transporting ATPase subunit C